MQLHFLCCKRTGSLHARGAAEVNHDPKPERPVYKGTAVRIVGLQNIFAVLSQYPPKFPNSVQEAASSPHMPACMALERCSVLCSSAQSSNSITLAANCTVSAYDCVCKALAQHTNTKGSCMLLRSKADKLSAMYDLWASLWTAPA